MKPNGLLQAELTGILASLGHTQTIVIADAGLPIPHGVRVIDLAVTAGMPSFLTVLGAVLPECVFEGCTLAEEIKTHSPALWEALSKITGALPVRFVPHEALKKLSGDSVCIVRTGETTPYANILLTGGVNF